MTVPNCQRHRGQHPPLEARRGRLRRALRGRGDPLRRGRVPRRPAGREAQLRAATAASPRGPAGGGALPVPRAPGGREGRAGAPRGVDAPSAGRGLPAPARHRRRRSAPGRGRGVGGPGSHGRVPRGPSRAECASSRRALAVVVPSVWEETFGLVVVEAKAAAVPAIATDHASFPDLIEPGRDGVLVPPGDPAALAEALAHVDACPVAPWPSAPRRVALRAAVHARAEPPHAGGHLRRRAAASGLEAHPSGVCWAPSPARGPTTPSVSDAS